MPPNTPTTVYLPTSVDEKPAKSGWYLCIDRTGDECRSYYSKDMGEWNQYVTHYLRPATGYFHTKEELGKLLSHVWDVAYSHFDGAGGPADDFLEGKEKFIQSIIKDK